MRPASTMCRARRSVCRSRVSPPPRRRSARPPPARRDGCSALTSHWTPRESGASSTSQRQSSLDAIDERNEGGDMDYRQLGASDLKIPALTLGTATFGGGSEFLRQWGASD